MQSITKPNAEQMASMGIVGQPVGTEAQHLKAPAGYTFEANRFYGPGERYSSGSGLSSTGLTLAQAKAHFDTYDVGGHTYCLTVTAPNGAVIHHKGPSKADTTRSMNAAYRRRNDPVETKPTTTVQNLRRAQAALQNMPYGGMMRLPRVNDKMTAALAVQEMTVALEIIRETLKGVGERHAADTAELERLRGVIRGGREFFAELQPCISIVGS